ncbi:MULTISPECIES: FxLYD domain-containing protein [unclassified Streptomyces]|uniref:FxLYD domain-containing protein n=1 Tax=unclassified Streptomyces TaxID=2593676 RepID=UPI002DDB5573|nr:FxLYD domain-containing protein [Streptomyces sp. NBC_01237]WRZ77736.1 FxLYD domain-containing protein [Streptomyces sp. NBC_01237]
MSYPQQPGQQPQQPQWGQQPGWGQQPPQQPKKKSTGMIVGFSCLGIVVLVIMLGIVGAVMGGTDSGSDEGGILEVTAPPTKAAEKKDDAPKEKDDAGPEGDVKITECEVNGATQWPAAKLEITNRSSKQSNYIVQVEFLDKDGTRLGEGTAATNNLAPAQLAKETAQGLAQVDGKVTCRVTKVTRYAS